MTGEREGTSAAASTRTSRVVHASADRIYAAFVDADALVAWLPPGVRPEDNDEGARLSLEQLARRVEPDGG